MKKVFIQFLHYVLALFFRMAPVAVVVVGISVVFLAGFHGAELSGADDSTSLGVGIGVSLLSNIIAFRPIQRLIEWGEGLSLYLFFRASLL